MGIPRFDFFQFLFNRGRGIRPDQVDWNAPDAELNSLIAGQATAAAGARQIHIVLNTAYNAVAMEMEGAPYEAVASIATGDLIFFDVPAAIPNLSQTAVLRLTVGSVPTHFQIFGAGLRGIPYNQIIPGVMHRGIRVPAGILLINATGSGSLSRRITVDVTDPQIRNLDTGYIELIPAPGAGKYLEIERVWMKLAGSDTLAVARRNFFFASNVSNDVTNVDVSVTGAISTTGGNVRNLPTWAGEDRYVYIGVHWTQPDPTQVGLTSNFEIATHYTRISGFLIVNGETYKVWRSNITYNSLSDFAPHGRIRIGRSGDAPSIGSFDIWSALAVTFILDTTSDKPLHSGEHSPVLSTPFGTFFRQAADAVSGGRANSHDLLENRALSVGAVMNTHRLDRDLYYDDAIWDAWLSDLGDRLLEIVVEYQIHSTFTI